MTSHRAQQPIQHIHLLNTIVRGQRRMVHRQEIFRIMVIDCVKRRELALQGPAVCVDNSVGHLIICLAHIANGDKVNFRIAYLADIHLISTPQQLQKDNIFENVPVVSLLCAKQSIPQADICGIILIPGFQVLLAFYIIASNFL